MPGANGVFHGAEIAEEGRGIRKFREEENILEALEAQTVAMEFRRGEGGGLGEREGEAVRRGGELRTGAGSKGTGQAFELRGSLLQARPEAWGEVEGFFPQLFGLLAAAVLQTFEQAEAQFWVKGVGEGGGEFGEYVEVADTAGAAAEFMDAFEQRKGQAGLLQVERMKGGFELTGVGTEAVDVVRRGQLGELANQLPQLTDGLNQASFIQRQGVAPSGRS